MEGRPDTTPTLQPFTVDLGQHFLEVQEERVVLIVEHAPGTGAVRLDGDETYKLLITLQELFK
jgi:hypothetical protein